MPFDGDIRQFQTQPDEVGELLRRALGYLERGWCQGSSARSADGDEREYHCDDAVSFCFMGALHRAQEDMGLALLGSTTVDRAIQRIAAAQSKRVPERSMIVKWNDEQGRTAGQVTALFRAAVELQPETVAC